MAKKAVKFTQDAIEKLPKNLPVVYIISSETEKALRNSAALRAATDCPA